MTSTELHRRAIHLAEIADRLVRDGDPARACRFYRYAARREMMAVKAASTVSDKATYLRIGLTFFENAMNLECD